MVMVNVDGSSLLVESQAKSVGLVLGLVVTRRSFSIHQMHWVNSRNGLAMITSLYTLSLVLVLLFGDVTEPAKI